ncbi:MAG: capsular biosynthesis protein, partial [Mangrovicoccus sp.]
IIAMERAPLPGRVTVDPVGVNQVNMLARDPDFYRSWASEQTSQREAGWRELKSKLVARAASKRSDVAQSAADSTLAETPFIFCPLQVPDDTQIKLFGGWVRTMDRFLMLLEFAASQLPEGWHLRVKEHPSSKIKLTSILEAAQAQLPGKIIIDNTTDTFAQVDASRLVLTLNSSVGLQAFWYDKPVAVLGEAFFRMPGLVTEVDGVSDLLRLFQNPDQASFDPDLRAAFMNYLDQVYYPEMEGDGAATRLRPEKVLPKIDLARASITKPT